MATAFLVWTKCSLESNLAPDRDNRRIDMKTKWLLSLALICFAASRSMSEDLTTLDGQKYQDIRDMSAKPGGLFFVTGDGDSMKGVTVAYTNLSEATKEQYHCDPYELGMAFARQNQGIYLNKNLAFSLDQLDAAKKKAEAEHKLLGFILVWDSFFHPAGPPVQPVGDYSENALAHFYDVFHDNMVLVFVSHERELGKVPPAVSQGFGGPDEGGYAPSMAVVTADCSKFICEIPYSKKNFTGREQIFRQKIAVIKKFLAANGGH